MKLKLAAVLFICCVLVNAQTGKNFTKDDLSFDSRDNAAHCPLASVIDTAFTWGDDRRPRTPGRPRGAR